MKEGALVGSWILVIVIAGAIGASTGTGADAGPSMHTDPDAGTLPGTLVIGFEDSLPADIGPWIEAREGTVEITNPTPSFVQASFADDADLDAIRHEIHQREDVAYVEPAYEVFLDEPLDETTDALQADADPEGPDDPLYPDQWGFPAIQAPEAWNTTRGDADVRVAVLDTGIDGDHPDLKDNLCGPHASFINDPDPLQDAGGHGTHVAGTIAAVTDNGIGVAGASDACLMSVRVLGAGASSAGIADAIAFAADHEADVISMSFRTGPSNAISSALSHAYMDNDVLIIKSAGNQGCFGAASPLTGTTTWPAPEDEVMPVAALAPSDGEHTAGYSSCGPNVEIAAPGSGVLSTTPHEGYGTKSGTSMAAPHTSGTAALVRSTNPGLSAFETRCVLTLTAETTAESGALGQGVPGWNPWTGWGRVNAHEAVTLAGSIDSPEASLPSPPAGCLLPPTMNPLNNA